MHNLAESLIKALVTTAVMTSSGATADLEAAPAALMTANMIDGKAVAAEIRYEIQQQVEELRSKYKRVPGLAVVIVGERKDSQTYVRMKKKACEEVGILSFGSDLPESATQAEVLKVVQDLNSNPDVHGILVQLPLPRHMDQEVVLGAISLEKDVDGFHPLNMGSLTMKGREPLFAPCTPLGCIELLKRCGIPIKGQRAVVVGRSNIVGMPVALLLNKCDATVTVCHSGTKDMEAIVRQADIVIAACGQPAMIKGSWIKPGAAVIDVGTNPVPDTTKKAGFRLVGDVEYDEAVKVAGAITPVPGGVGPMTITMLLKNTLASAQRAMAKTSPGVQGRLRPKLPWMASGGADGMAAVGLGALVLGAVLRHAAAPCLALLQRTRRRSVGRSQ
ncbi:tetrahydrofolate dehydrogenase/cyclohydrolase [Haematococcus lacustris]